MKNIIFILLLSLAFDQAIIAQNNLPRRLDISSISPRDSQSFKANSTILASGNVQVLEEAKVSMLAGDSIVLRGGFQAKAGSHFYARITKQSQDSSIGAPGNFQSTQSMVYPNPTSGVFNVVLPNAPLAKRDGQIEIRDVWGRIILQKYQVNPENGSFQIDLSTQESGLYFLFMRTTNTQIRPIGKIVLIKS
jgi:hypothetical protein